MAHPPVTAVIAVIGEALIDLVAGFGSGVGGEVAGVVPRPGGAGFNTARMIGRLGQPVVFLDRLADDGFGELLRDSLIRDGVTPGVTELTTDPTTLAVVHLDDAGSPTFRFYLAGTSAPDLSYPALRDAFPWDATAVHAGSLALVMEPVASAIERLILRDLPPETLVMIDPNWRPAAITDPAAHRERLFRLVARADVVKVSVEDLGYLFPAAPPRAAAAGLREHTAGIVLVTDGPRAAWAVLPSGEVPVDVPPVTVVDTIGAGDAFGGSFLAWWTGRKLSRSELFQPEPVREALQAAVEVAALTCTRAGAEPPRLAELAGRPGWSGPS